MTDELKPCPLCGGDMEMSGQLFRHTPSERCLLRDFGWGVERIGEWNTRSTTTPVTEGDEVERVARGIFNEMQQFSEEAVDRKVDISYDTAPDEVLDWSRRLANAAIAALATRTVTEGDLREAAELAACYFEEGGKLGRSVPTIILKQLRAALATRPVDNSTEPK